MRRFSGGLGALSRKRSLIHGTKSDFDVRTPMYPRSNSLLPGLSTIPKPRKNTLFDIEYEPESVFILLHADSVLRIGWYGWSRVFWSPGWVGGGTAGVSASVRLAMCIL